MERLRRIRRAALGGLTIGITLGGVFGLAVVSFADCVEPNCSLQRLVGVLVHAAAGGGVGAAGGLLLHALGRLALRFRR